MGGVNMEYRIGIDVGGTFTDAVALDNSTMELVGIVKIPTTHHHPYGVSEGIRLALLQLMEQCSIRPEDVVFIAHGTTQATNALLEGDVDRVAIVSSGSGLGASHVRRETSFKALTLDGGKELHVENCFIRDFTDEKCSYVINNLLERGIKSIAASTAYSVDNPETEDRIRAIAEGHGMYCTCSHHMSGLYGLRTRTKTAVINASIISKMVDTTDFMIQSVHRTGIQKPLMIMRSDGGIMDASEIKKKPIHTILSGPAAGVAGALLYGRYSEGIFLEVGGTSTDISAIHNGQVMVKWAHIGSHKTYINSLDIHTLAIAGGSMLRKDNGHITGGPRSAHIAGLSYVCFADDLHTDHLEILPFHFQDEPSEYYTVRDGVTGTIYAITLTCLANFKEYIHEGDFSFGSRRNTQAALEALSLYLEISIDKILEQVFSSACSAIQSVITDFTQTYNLNRNELKLIGGGGGCQAILPLLSETLHLPCSICPDAQAISPIGVAMAMVHEICERNSISPTENELMKLREEAVQKALLAGAAREQLRVKIETDPMMGIVRAIATGVTDSRLRTIPKVVLSEAELFSSLEEQGIHFNKDYLKKMHNGHYWIYETTQPQRNWLKRLLFSEKTSVVVASSDGTVKINKQNGHFIQTNRDCLERTLNQCMDEASVYGDTGERIPDIFLVVKDRIIDYSMVCERMQILKLASFELKEYEPEDAVVLIYIPLSGA